MMFGDSLYKDKDRRGRPRFRSSDTESNFIPFPPAENPTRAWLVAPPRSILRVGKYILILLLVLVCTFWFSLSARLYRLQSSGVGEHKHPFCALPESRAGELKDTLVGYKHRGGKCNLSSLDLHVPFGAICPDRSSMLTAMSSGGRIGRDSPYIPRGCDMQWFGTWEACEILGRYSQVILVGDSMLRHVIGALNILIREDLGYGGVTDWNFSEEEKQECFCNNQFNVRGCSIQGIFSTADVIKHDPLSLVCPKVIPDWNTDLRIEQIVRYPIPNDERRRFEKEIDSNPLQRKAFILGHGLWNNLEVDQAASWLEAVLDMIESRTGARTQLRGRSPRKNLPVLLVTPNAAGDKKPDEWLVSQGNKALVQFEHAMAVQAAKRRVDHLGTWNMSIQATLYDGVHMDMRGNLVKAMMVLNWLNLLDV